MSRIKEIYRRFVPRKVRRLRVVQWIKRRLVRDVVYGEEYYSFIDRSTSESAGAMARTMRRELSGSRLVDVGCGSGALIAELQSAGFECLGLEYSKHGLRLARARGLNVLKFNILKDRLPRRFDVCVSMEVAEHLPERAAGLYVHLLTSLSDLVVFTAATPGQGGLDHVNEQPHSYWIRKFENHGFLLDAEMTASWRAEWSDEGVASWFAENVMLFRKEAG